ncbi:MAG: hypothetical protein JST16_00595 [Bdellovibrionales bacterium]|nr:hypothetical protein [Bdellovibrionales bacterium]
MTAFVLWIDSEHAKIFQFTPAGVETHAMKRAEPDHHTHASAEKHNSEHFFHQVADKLKAATELLIVGPGLAKSHFKTHLEQHHHQALAKKVLGVEAMDHPTDAQIMAAGRKFFTKAHLYS